MNNYRGDAANNLSVGIHYDVSEHLSAFLAFHSHSCCQILRRVCLKLCNKKLSFLSVLLATQLLQRMFHYNTSHRMISPLFNLHKERMQLHQGFRQWSLHPLVSTSPIAASKKIGHLCSFVWSPCFWVLVVLVFFSQFSGFSPCDGHFVCVEIVTSTPGGERESKLGLFCRGKCKGSVTGSQMLLFNFSVSHSYRKIQQYVAIIFCLRYSSSQVPGCPFVAGLLSLGRAATNYLCNHSDGSNEGGGKKWSFH